MNKKIITLLLSFLVLCFSDVSSLMGQCFNTVKYPATDNSAPSFSGQIDTISTTNIAGHYCVVKDLIPGRSYTFSSKAGDYITHRIVGGLVSNAPLGGGNSPYTFTATGHNGEFHINLISPPCVTDMINRTTTIVCNDCPAEPAKVGVGQVSPKATLDVKGEIKIDDSGRSPVAGMVRWNSSTNDFEGYDGSQWRSFTKSPSSWGNERLSPTAIEDKKLLASDGVAYDNFGYSVSISGDYAVIGAYLDDVGANTNQGSAYVFVRSGTTWTHQAKLTASDGAASDQFGYSVSISGDYVVVGAPYDDIGANSNQGSVYVFVRSGTTWAQQVKLIASDGASSDFFGFSVSISGTYAVIGANGDDVGFLPFSNDGSAYVFVRSGITWPQQAKLTASDHAASDFFGTSVSISGDYVVIGAYGDDSQRGSAYDYKRSGTTWSQQAKLAASDGVAGDNFGYSVSISGRLCRDRSL